MLPTRSDTCTPDRANSPARSVAPVKSSAMHPIEVVVSGLLSVPIRTMFAALELVITSGVPYGTVGCSSDLTSISLGGADITDNMGPIGGLVGPNFDATLQTPKKPIAQFLRNQYDNDCEVNGSFVNFA